MKKISIIIPIYNVEKYLERCLESITIQKKIEEIEVLLIDDGSTDESAKISDKYSKRFENFHVYHKENGGLSDARNFGIKKATGEYLVFLDSDDCLDESFIEKLQKKIDENIDIILWNATSIDEDDNELYNEKYQFAYKGLDSLKNYDAKELICLQLKNVNEFPTTVWLGAYRREMILENNLWFEKKLLHEDEMWTLKVILEAKKIGYIDDTLYKYRIRENSIMREDVKKNINHVSAFIYIFNSLYEYYDWKVKDEELAKALKDNLSKRYLHAIAKWKFDKYPNLLNNINKKKILKNSVVFKNRIRAIILNINPRIYCILSRIGK